MKQLQAITLMLTLGWIGLMPLPAEARKKKGEVEISLAETMPAILGPKRTVAVGPVSSKSDFVFRYGSTDVGGGLSAMLSSALVESGRFVVVERNQLSTVLSEQELQNAGVLEETGGPTLGNLTGAQWMILLAVSEFDQQVKGGGFGVGVGRELGLGLSPRKSVGIVGLEARVVDTSSGEVVVAFQVREEVKSRALKISVDVDDVSLGHDSFKKTPIGAAARAAINEVVRRFAETVAHQEWKGSVVDYEHGEVSINAGASSGVRVGDSFAISRTSKVLTDPVTGRVLGSRKRTVGEIVIEHVDENLSFGLFEPMRDMHPQRGDIVSLPSDG